MTNPNQAPGFIDHVPSQAELVASAEQAELSEMALTMGALKAIREGRDAGAHPAELNQMYPSEATAAPSQITQKPFERPTVSDYEEPESERVISPDEHRALLQKLRDKGEI